ncbi:MAG TPA: alkaline phosphatase family protein [Acidobacteriaceae bacterium]|nr:alkaline phosphatase family protein [Acidobacteriaceae bacterium]
MTAFGFRERRWICRLTLGLIPLLCLMAFSTSATAATPKQNAAGAKPDPDQELVANLRAHIHHVFLIYQENRSFDSYFGSFPGADNLATAEARTHGFRQWDAIGHEWITPFLLKAADTADADHSREALLAKSDHGRMDNYIGYEEKHLVEVSMASPQFARQVGILTMAHEDCHTVPFLWMYAHRFALYDHIFQAMYGPSTPGNIDLIAGQTGQTQAARHPNEAFKSSYATGEPVVNDANPDFGPYAFPFQVNGEHQLDQTYATLMLTLSGANAKKVKVDTDDIKDDINELVLLNHRAVPWAWYQEGFGNGEGDDHPAYIPHHNAPQYFGYIRQNPSMWRGEHDLLDFFTMMKADALPPKSVVFIKGGRLNPFGWKPANPYAQNILGDDDHPGYSDSQLSESLVAKVVNTVARSPYWKDSVIILVWDDSEGFYDHVPPPQFEQCPDKEPCGDGPRVPLILISPYAKSGAIVKDPGDHVSFAKFLDVLFQLPAMASLPDEKPYMPEGPRDANPRLTNLLGGFSAARLAGTEPPIPASQAEIPDAIVNHFPPAMTCKDTGVTPVVIPGASLTPPRGFTNPLP